MRNTGATDEVGPTGGTALPRYWWAPGLALSERCGAPSASEAAPEPTGYEQVEREQGGLAQGGHEITELARRRLTRWYDAHELGASGQFAARLAQLGLTEGELLALLSEPTSALGARTRQPSWASFTKAALPQAPKPTPETPSMTTSDEPGAPTTGADRARVLGLAGEAGGATVIATGSTEDTAWADSFARIVSPFVNEAATRLRRRCAEAAIGADPNTASGVDQNAAGGVGPDSAGGVGDAASAVDLDAVLAGFVAGLSDRLVRLSARTLVLELNVMRSAGRLVGDSADERFADFVRRLSTPAALTQLLVAYPVLARLLAQAAEYSVAATAELLERFVADRTAIVGTLLRDVDPGALVGVGAGAGDRHQRGRAVALLRFATGARVVYKPKPMAAHGHFNEVVSWLNAHLPGLELRTLVALGRPGYGWVEFVAPAPCAERAEVERFYHRQGALLALLYALDAADVHFENVIACADQPVLVDIETLFHPSMAVPGTAGADPAADALASSVYRVALLPQLLLGADAALDISGLGGDKGRQLPLPVVGWDAAATDEMRLARRTGIFAGGDNRPRLHGEDADPTAFSGALLGGFRAGYDAIATHRAELIDAGGLLRRSAEDEVRVVMRPTRVYATLLDESTHPDVLRDALDRDQLLDVLWAGSVGDPVRLRLVPHELSELWHSDVPMFLARPGHRHLWTSEREQLVNVLDEAPLDHVISKIQNMGEVDRYDQEWIMRATLATRLRHGGHDSGTPMPPPYAETAPEPDRLLAAARGLADQIIARGYDNGDRVNWLGLELLDERHWTVMPLGAGLASGYTGVAMFLAQLAALTGDTRYAAVARRALRPLPRLIEHLAAQRELAEAVGCGGFAGLGGIAYALTQISVLLEDASIAASVDAVVQLAAQAIDADTEFGVVGGSAGCLAAMLAVHRILDLESAWAAAVRCTDRLMTCPANAVTSPGFAFGSAGVGWALLRFAAAVDSREHAQRGLDWLRETDDLGTGAGHSWCQGSPGIGLALLDAADLTDNPWARGVVDRSVDAVISGGPLPNHSLCHGELGRLELLGAAARTGPSADTTFSAAQLSAAQVRCGGMVLAALDQSGPRCGTPGDAPSPGLLTGLAGIGHGLLRLGFPDNVPSALLLQAPLPQLRMPSKGSAPTLWRMPR